LSRPYFLNKNVSRTIPHGRILDFQWLWT